jgi:hypothetical protein
LSDQAERLNDDQIADMEREITSLNARKTYEEGFQAAMVKMETEPEYQSAYVEGYHQAIGQNQEHIQHLQALINQTKDEQIAEQGQP